MEVPYLEECMEAKISGEESMETKIFSFGESVDEEGEVGAAGGSTGSDDGDGDGENLENDGWLYDCTI